MKKYILGIVLFVLFSKNSNAQVSFGLKGSYIFFGTTFNEIEIMAPKGSKEPLPDYLGAKEDDFGFNAGIWARIKIPFLGWGVRPELNYVYLNSSLKGLKNPYIIQKIDVPILLNKSFFGVLNVFVGPSFQYLIKQKSLEGLDGKDVSSSDFTMGIQYGIGVEIRKFGIDLRMDQSFGKDVNSLVEYTTDAQIRYQIDNRPSLFVVGLYYKLF